MNEELKRLLLEKLEYGEIHYFRDWSNSIAPNICIGVYTIWEDEQLIYVGMSGRGLDAVYIDGLRNDGITKEKGLFTRLASHASGIRSGDQFCVYVADRLVLPILTREQIEAIASNKLKFDNINREYIHTHFYYRYVEMESGKLALKLETDIKNGALKAGKPLLNPGRKS